MTIPPEVAAEILKLPATQKLIEEAGSPVAKQVGKFGEDVGKALRLVTAPIQVLGAYQDRLEVWLDRVIRNIPEENLQPPPAALAGPILEALKYRTDSDSITELYLTLLQKAMNKEKIGQVHPAFIRILEQLSPDEVMLLRFLKSAPLAIGVRRVVVNGAGLSPMHTLTQGLDDGTQVIKLLDEGLEKNLTYPKNITIYLSHLDALHLGRLDGAPTPVLPTYSDLKFLDGTSVKHLQFPLTDFGKMFVTACDPS